MRFASRDVRDPIDSSEIDHGPFLVALKSDAKVEKAKNQLWRDFPRRSIFDFCNKSASNGHRPGSTDGSDFSKGGMHHRGGRIVLAMASANISFSRDLVNSLGCSGTGLRLDTTL